MTKLISILKENKNAFEYSRFIGKEAKIFFKTTKGTLLTETHEGQIRLSRGKIYLKRPRVLYKADKLVAQHILQETSAIYRVEAKPAQTKKFLS